MWLVGHVGFGDRDVDGDRNQQRLRGHRRACARALQPLVDRALVRGVHVDEHETVRRLREDVDAVQLRDRVPERIVVADRRSAGDWPGDDSMPGVNAGVIAPSDGCSWSRTPGSSASRHSNIE